MLERTQIIAINYSDSKYENQRKYNTKTAYEKGKVDKVIEYSPDDIDLNFKEKNKAIFSYTRGAGLWLWKPYIIYKTLLAMNEGDYLFYCDAGAYYVNNIKFLIATLEKRHVAVMPFEISLLARQWTKKEAFSIMGYDNYSQNQICAGYVLLKKNEISMSLVKEWLDYMQDERVLSYKKYTSEEDFEDFVEHRDDQSVFSLVCRKNGIEVFRDPSQFGDRPWEYAWVKNYKERWKQWTLSEKKYKNSPYPRIVVSNRGVDPIKYKRKEFVKNILWKLGVYNRYYFKYKLGAII